MGVPSKFVHEVDFYSDDSAFVDRLSRKLAADLRRGRGTIVVATETHRAGLNRELQSQGFDLDAARSTGRYVCLDAGETLEEMSEGGSLSAPRFAKSLGGLIAEVSRHNPDPHVTVFGEMVALLVARGKANEAIRLERLGNELGAQYDFSVRCAYPMGLFQTGGTEDVFLQVCREHSAVYSH